MYENAYKNSELEKQESVQKVPDVAFLWKKIM
ncbi:MAG: hypothetical protein UR30_C0012G0016 [Candidatus Peregrinibacteria bacterium GW2011_GWC2_33_13]|nr:MAG: hypothetical protein UR30_C0012G0016 [Candidatus Peregrinibacteria bacterium GW2011_GWC2_33_13]